MRYLTQTDLTANSYERFITDSSKDDPAVLDRLEDRAIALAATFMERFDTDTIFGTYVPAEAEGDPPVLIPGIRHALLIEIIAKITLYNLFRRNAARKIPEDIKEDYDWAVKELERIRNGATTLKGLPPAIDENGQPISNTIWGNNANGNFYI